MPVRSISGSDPDYAYIQELGRGSFGVVLKVRRKKDSKVPYLLSCIHVFGQKLRLTPAKDHGM
jgi:hypothetical protein